MKVLIGNLFDSPCQCLVNTINCVGVMGKGVALEFKKRYPDNFKDYVSRCKRGEVKPGLPYFYQDKDRLILNFPTKDHWRMTSRLSDVATGLDWFVAHYKDFGVASVAFPPLGCGNGGLTWEEVGPLMYRKLKDLPIEIEAYAPYGTSLEHLSTSFLEKAPVSLDATGRANARIKPSWYLTLEAVKELNERPFALRVDRLLFQKICYIMTSLGLDTGFSFARSEHGPYSAEVLDAFKALANAGLVHEKNLGDRIQIEVNESFRFDPAEYGPEEIKILKKTADLFGRIHSSLQSEIVSSVVYAFNELKEKPGAMTDQSLFDRVMETKPSWGEKRREVLASIYYLKASGFISVYVPRQSSLLNEIDYL